MRFFSLLASFYLVLIQATVAQLPNKGATLLIHCDDACTIRVDGDSFGSLPTDGTKKISVVPGEHLVSAVSTAGKKWVRTVSVETGRQVVAEVSFSANGNGDTVSHGAGSQVRPVDSVTTSGTGGFGSTANGEKSGQRSSTATAGGKTEVSVIAGWYKWENVQTKTVRLGNSSCSVDITEQLLFQVPSAKETYPSSVAYSRDVLLSKNVSDACLDHMDDPEASAEMRWNASIEIKSSGDGFAFAGKISNCKSCSFGDVKGRAARIDSSSLSISLERPTEGQYRVSTY